MKNSIILKFIAVALCAAALLGAGGSGISFLVLGSAGLLSGRDFDSVYAQTQKNQQGFVAREIARSWASNSLGGLPAEITDEWRAGAIANFYDADQVYYTITDEDGTVLESNYNGEEVASSYTQDFGGMAYERLWKSELWGNEADSPPLIEEASGAVPESSELPAQNEIEAEDTVSEETVAVTEPTSVPIDTQPTETYPEEPTEYNIAPAFIEPHTIFSGGFYSQRLGRYYNYNYTEEYAPECRVTLYLGPDAQLPDPGETLLYQLWLQKKDFGFLLGISLLLFAVSAVYLCCCAGRSPGTDTVQAGGLNRLPLDVYAFLVLIYAGIAGAILDTLSDRILHESLRALIWCGIGLGFVGCLIFVGFCFAFAAQIKTGNRFWLRNLLCVRAVRFCFRLCRTAVTFLWPPAKRLGKALFVLAAWLVSFGRSCLVKALQKISAGLRFFTRQAEQFFSRLPLTWQWLLTGCGMILLLLVCFAGNGFTAFCGITVSLLLILYGANAFGTLMEAAQKMRSGNLDAKIDSRYLVGCFRDFARELNGLADVAVVAAQKQLKSERMKTELITNVSHDIKTPLTSIVSYVDLLTKPHTPEEETLYLEVLARQSGRMKKLIEDLIEMSRANTGNIPVEITEMDAAEAVTQALGEFSDKLDAAKLTPVFHRGDGDLRMLADGRLVWRAMSNLLSNTVKYAMPGTRLYLDVSRAENSVVISIKNISRAELNISADDLLERFVRGDTSRNTEGSGLGLNIAKSLMELQNGQLQLLVDGDLFKVTLIFPKA